MDLNQPIEPNDSAEQYPNGVEIHRFATVNVLPIGPEPENGPFVLATVIRDVAPDDGEILVRDINGEEYEVSIERLRVYPPQELLKVLNRYLTIGSIINDGIVDPLSE